MIADPSLKQKIESVMRRREKASLLSLSSALYAVSLLYGAGIKLRNWTYRMKLMPARQLPCRVLCVGNITLGGTGKTPMAIYVAKEIRQMGYSAAVVSRGYRGDAESSGGIVSDGRSILMGPKQAGDEPYLIACSLNKTPVIVGKSRYAAGMLACEKFRPDVIVLDDGFQHLRLNRDIDLVLLDHGQPFGNLHLLPRGPLREPLSSLARSHAIVLTRHKTGRNDSAAASIEAINKYAPKNPVFTSTHDPYFYLIKGGQNIPVECFNGRRSNRENHRSESKAVFGFSGIARNLDFQHTVKALGFEVKGFLEFSDHHHYTIPDLQDIQSRAEDAGARQLITTEKDLVRLSPSNPFSLDLFAVGIQISFGDDRQNFRSFIKKRLSL